MAKAKFTTAEKLNAVLGVLEEGLSHRKAGVRVGATNSSHVQKWVRLYKEHGIEGLSIKNWTYDGQFKIDVIEYMHTNHLSFNEAAAKFGIPGPASVSTWNRIYNEEGREALFSNNGRRKGMGKARKPKKQNLDKNAEEDIIAENQRLRMENAYLKKLNALVQERIQRENGKK